VKPRDLIATAKIPGNTQELRCYHHDGAHEVWVGHTELMSSRVHGSEEMLAELALERLGPRPATRVLVGGLGMGFTLARTLALIPGQGKAVVAELVPEVVTWNQELFGHHAEHPLRDPRTTCVVADVRELVTAPGAAYDAILLDVDNGPDGLTKPGNGSLYNKVGLQSLRDALTPNGVLGVWSSADDRNFDQRLRQAQFDVQKHRVRARRTKGPWRTIWIAQKP
jgi:spermidine synthase